MSSVQHGREVVIVEAVRTAIGRGHREKGVFRDVHPNALLGATYTEVVRRAGIDPAAVENVATSAAGSPAVTSHRRNPGRDATDEVISAPSRWG